MTLNYKTSSFNKEELEWAISLVEAEFKKEERNTPEKMSTLIRNNFDVMCEPGDILHFFKINEDYDRENNRVECGYSPEPGIDQEGGPIY